jgi:hypothetical protein
VLLAGGVQRGGPGEGGVDLFLAIGQVVVLGEVLEVRREVLDLDPNALTPRPARTRQNPPMFGESNSSTRFTVTSDICAPPRRSPWNPTPEDERRWRKSTLPSRGAGSARGRLQ